MVGIDSAMHIGSMVLTKADTNSNIGFVGKAQASSVLALVHPEPSHHSSSSRCLLYFPLVDDMLFNPSHHSLLICKI